MKVFNLCLLGLGNVGRALVLLLQRKGAELRDEFGIEFRVTGVGTRSMGLKVEPGGFALAGLCLGALTGGRAAGSAPAPGEVREWLTAAGCDVLFETTPLEPLTGEPAVSYARAALERGAHVVTANKGTIVHAHGELSELARSRGRRFMFESAVADCLPVFSLFRSSLPAARLEGFAGVLNSTTTVILEEIERGGTYEDGVRRALELGVAEADPSHDVDGWDAAAKLCAVANVLMGARLRLEDVSREGIRGLSDEEVRGARASGRPLRLLARASRGEGGRVAARVGPERLEPGGPFSSVAGTSLAVHFRLDVLPGLTLVEHAPDLRSTAYGMLADFVNAVKGER